MVIKKRTKLTPIRMELSRKINDKAKKELFKFLGIGIRRFIDVGTPLYLSFVFGLQNYLKEKSELVYERRSPRIPADVDMKMSVMEQVERQDIGAEAAAVFAALQKAFRDIFKEAELPVLMTAYCRLNWVQVQRRG